MTTERKIRPETLCEDFKLFSATEMLFNIRLRHPYLQLKKNSALAAAVFLENQKTDLPTLRKRWPEDFCGYIQSLLQQEIVATKNLTAIKSLGDIADFSYDPDECITQKDSSSIESQIFNRSISKGVTLPGTLPYSLCESEELRDLFEDILKVEWSVFFENPVFVGFEDAPPELREALQPLDPDEVAGMVEGLQLEVGDSEGVPACTTRAMPSHFFTGGFVWKVKSEGDGRLVVLLPTGFRGGRVRSVSLISRTIPEIPEELAEFIDPEQWSPTPIDQFIESGRFSGDIHNGCRPHYRFSRRGNEYPPNVILQATLTSGIILEQTITNPGRDIRL